MSSDSTYVAQLQNNSNSNANYCLKTVVQFEDACGGIISVPYLPVLLEEDSSELTASSTSDSSSDLMSSNDESPNPSVILRVSSSSPPSTPTDENPTNNGPILMDGGENGGELDDECSYSLLDARAHHLDQVQANDSAVNHDHDSNVYEDGLMPTNIGANSNNSNNNNKEADSSQEAEDENNYERLAIDNTGHVNGVVTVEQDTSDRLINFSDAPEDDYCTLATVAGLNGEPALIATEEAFLPSSDYVDIDPTNQNNKNQEGLGHDEEAEENDSERIYDALNVEQQNNKEVLVVATGADYETVVITTATTDDTNNNNNNDADKCNDEQPTTTTTTTTPSTAITEDEPTTTTTTCQEELIPVKSEIVMLEPCLQASTSSSSEVVLVQTAPTGITNGVGYEEDAGYVEQEPASAVLVKAEEEAREDGETSTTTTNNNASSFTAITLQLADPSTITNDVSPSTQIIEAAPVHIELEEEEERQPPPANIEGEVDKSDQQQLMTVVVTTLAESLTGSSEFSSLDQPSSNSNNSNTNSNEEATTSSQVSPQFSADLVSATDDQEKKHQEEEKEEEQEDVKPAVPKQRVSHNIDIIQSNGNGYVNGDGHVHENGFHLNGNGHHQNGEEKEQVEDQVDEEDEEEVALTPAQYPPRGEYILQQATFPSVKTTVNGNGVITNGKSNYVAPVEDKRQEEPTEETNGNQENPDIVHNDVIAVKPEELEEVRRCGVAASLRRQWETIKQNEPSSEQQQQEQQQVVSGTARNLRRMFETNTLPKEPKDAPQPLPVKHSLGSTGSLSMTNKWRAKTPEFEVDAQNGNKQGPKWNVHDPREVSKRLSHTPRTNSEDQQSNSSVSGDSAKPTSGSNDALDGPGSGASSVRGDEENTTKVVFENTPTVREDAIRGEDNTLSELEQLRQVSAARNVRNVFQQLLASSANGNTAPAPSASQPGKTNVTPKRLVLQKYTNGNNGTNSPKNERVSTSGGDPGQPEDEPKPAPGTARSMAQLFANKSPQHHANQYQPGSPSSNGNSSSSSQFRWRVDDPRERSRQLKQADVRSGDAIQNDEIRKPSLVVIQSQK